MISIKSFASVDRFLAELRTPNLRPGYVLAGDEAFLYQRCRAGILEALAPPDQRDFCLHDLDLAETSIFEVLDRAQTPSLMVPFQTLFVRGLKSLYTRGSKKAEFDAIDAYFRHPNPQALLIFVADHLSIPTDLRRMDLQDKERYERIRETLGEWCGMVELARVEGADAVRWLAAEAPARSVRIDGDAARELVDALGADMMLISSEFEKLCLYVQGKQLLPTLPRPAVLQNDPAVILTLSDEQGKAPHISSSAPPPTAVILNEGKDPGISASSPLTTIPSRVPHPSQPYREGWGALPSPPSNPLPPQNPVPHSSQPHRDEWVPPPTQPLPTITLGDVETMVLAAKQRSLYELTDAISRRDRPQALALLHGLLNSSDGGEDSAIGHLYMLARTFRQMLIIVENNVRDSRALWNVLWQGFRMPPFAADDLIRQARRYKSRSELTVTLRLIARADLELRSSPPDKRLVLERLVLALATEPKPPSRHEPLTQFAMEL